MKLEQTAVKEKVRSYIMQSVHVDNDKIKDSTLVFKEGFLDSMGFIVLITFLEEEFKIKTNDSDLIEENFESINSITDFVIRKSES
jgi:acyl carrier protein